VARINFFKFRRINPLIPSLLSFAILLAAVLILYLSFQSYIKPVDNQPNVYPEIQYLTGKNMDFDQLKLYFQQLARSKGAVYAFEILNKAPIPYGTDMHLLAHSVGDELYKQKGIDGMKYCTDDFRNACSHTIVINLFYEKGEAGLAEISKACKEAPGEGGYNMCYHGLGHGVFAYAGYELPKTDKLCKEVANNNLTGPEYKECMGGAVMEQISGGDHDKTTWQLQRTINLRSDKPLFPCMTSLVPEPARQTCLVYLTPYLWELAGKNSADVPDEMLIKSSEYCDAISKNDQKNREACFGGFGKEFLAMAKGKDIRHIDQLTDEEMGKIYRWCSLIPYKDGQEACVKYVLGSMYWGGANDKKLVEHFCALAPTEELNNYCFQRLISTIGKGEKQNPEYLKEFCNEIPESLHNQCQKQLFK